MLTKKNGYPALCSALEKSKQSGAHQILKELYHEESSCDVTKETSMSVTPAQNLLSVIYFCFIAIVAGFIMAWLIFLIYPGFRHYPVDFSTPPMYQIYNSSNVYFMDSGEIFFSQNGHSWVTNSSAILLDGPGNQIFIEGVQNSATIQTMCSRLVQLESLYLNNSSHKMCQSALPFSKEGSFGMIFNKTIRHLTLESFDSSCIPLLHLLSQHANAWNLQSLTFIGGNLNYKTVIHLESVLQQTETTLSDLQFKETSVSAPLFLTESQIFIKMRSITFNFSFALTYMPKRLCKKFPRLHDLDASQFPLPKKALKYFFGFKNLTTLRLKIAIPERFTNFSVNFVSKEFPSLREAYLDLEFAVCLQENKGIHKTVFVLDYEEVLNSPNIQYFQLVTNCRGIFF